MRSNDGTYHFNLFSDGTVLTGNLDMYHILYTQPIRASMGSPVSSHTAGPLSLSGEHTLGAHIMNITPLSSFMLNMSFLIFQSMYHT